MAMPSVQSPPLMEQWAVTARLEARALGAMVAERAKGVPAAGTTGEREMDSYAYRIESERGVDVRKPLFYAMSERGWPILGLESTGMSLEEVFVRLMDRTGA